MCKINVQNNTCVNIGQYLNIVVSVIQIIQEIKGLNLILIRIINI